MIINLVVVVGLVEAVEKSQKAAKKQGKELCTNCG
jgi:hypothetical protein